MTVTSGEPPVDGPEREGEDRRRTIRLFVEDSLESGASLALGQGQVHYLRNVMRRAPGDRVRLFNGRDGEWEGSIESIAPRRAAVRLMTQIAGQTPPPDVQLLFAPLKATRTRFVVEKATELGVAAIRPVLTRYGQTARVNAERLRAHAIEAAEQCGRLDVPAIAPPCPLADALAGWSPERGLLVCDTEAESSITEALTGAPAASWAILIGPEGGFAPDERRLLADHPSAVHARLGPRILRAETAVAAALACFQALAGDWR